MHIPSLKRYITVTHKMFSNNELSTYWNMGYINALRDRKLINDKERNVLGDYNSKIKRKANR